MKRHKNEPLRRLIASGVSQRQIAFLLNLSRTTVVRKFPFTFDQSHNKHQEWLKTQNEIDEVYFDDLETFEHTKCKPISVVAMVRKDRRVLGLRVARFPAKGLLAAVARKKYPSRPDERRTQREALFAELKSHISPHAIFKSDESPHYPKTVMRHFPLAEHIRYKGKRGATTGQGELKKLGFDPLFSLNHTYAMFRANINRLFRKTLCTTKKPERLLAHLYVYIVFHNEMIERKLKTA